MVGATDAVDKGLAGLRVIVFALAAGVTLFLIVAAVLAPVGDAAMQSRGPLFVGIAFVLASAHVVAYFVVERAMAAKIAALPRAREVESAAARFPLYQARTILGCALAEGAALVAIVFYLLTGAYALTVIPVLSILAMALQLPSRDKFDSFVGSPGRR